MTSPNLDPRAARRQIDQLHRDLKSLVERDPEQEVRGLAVSVVDLVLGLAASATSSPAIVDSVKGVITPEAIDGGEPLRAADLLVIAGQVQAALPHPLSGGRFARKDGFR